jgi:hypothetical protein
MKKYNWNKFFATIITYIITGVVVFALYTLSTFLPGWVVCAGISAGVLFHAIRNAKRKK